MPGLDQRGPHGEGPMTGWKAGKCTDFDAGNAGMADGEKAGANNLELNAPETKGSDTGLDRMPGIGKGMGLGRRRGGGRGAGRGNVAGRGGVCYGTGYGAGRGAGRTDGSERGAGYGA
ncbi:MAG TPA: DUF5320 domain-containing protein, partial [Bacteroidales bacterium]|nr:DUF5320 domain-containing protein [Bacteroidales bacterium]